MRLIPPGLEPSDVLSELYTRDPILRYAGPTSVVLAGGRYFHAEKAFFFPSDMVFDTVESYPAGDWMRGRDWAVWLDENGVPSLECLDPGDPDALSNEELTSSLFEVDGVRMRCLGGFHTLCADVGDIPGHPLSGMSAGDIVPASVWSANRRPACADPTGMVLLEPADVWIDIYNCSGDLENLKSRFGGLRSGMYAHSEYVTALGLAGKRLPTPAEFFMASNWSNCRTVADGFGVLRYRSDGTYYDRRADTTGGRSDADGRRMVSGVGCEEMCGLQDQWLRPVVPSTSFNSIAMQRGRANTWSVFGAVTASDYSSGRFVGKIVNPRSLRGPLGASNAPPVQAMKAGGRWVPGGNTDAGPLCVSHDENVEIIAFSSQMDNYSYIDPYDRDRIVAGGLPITDGDEMRLLFTGARGVSKCLHRDLSHHVYIPDTVPDYVWVQNVWSGDFWIGVDGSSVNSDIPISWEYAFLDDFSNWSATNSRILVKAGRTICFRAPGGVENRHFTRTFRPYTSQTGSGSSINGGMVVGGNIMSVLRQGATEFPSNAYGRTMESLFAGTAVKSAKRLFLPANTLVSGCYNHMFDGAAYLEDVPEIPGVAVVNGSGSNTRLACESMFSGCARLKNAPGRLGLETAQYSEMFRNCASLEYPPSITTARFDNDAECCQNMFFGCTSLKTVPVLRVYTPVSGNQYYGGMRRMFGIDTESGRTGIRFSATRDYEYRYEWSIPPLESGTDHENAFSGMLNGTTPSRGVKYYFTVPPVE